HTSLAIAQEMLRLNPNATVYFNPKSGSPGSDLTLKDTKSILIAGARDIFADLARFKKQGRFELIPDGPHGHGLDPGRISRAVGQALAEASVILAEGQAYAEIRG